MGNGLLFDLTTVEKAMNSLSEFIGKDKREIFMCLIKNNKKYCNDDNKIYDKFLEELNIDLDKLSLDELEIKSIHVTTGNDNGNSIKKNGLKNLRETIKTDTPMKKFLNDREIEIDIEKQEIKYQGKCIFSEDEQKKCVLDKNFIFHKLNKDYLINGFHYANEPIKYGGGVAYRPEFIAEVGKLINGLEYEWRKIFNQCYIVEYKANPYNYEWFNYQIDNIDKEMFEDDKDYYIKTSLIKNSISVIVEDINDSKADEIFSYAKFDYNVPSSDIINIIDVTSQR